MIQSMSNEDYHAEREHVSSSGLKLMLKDPKSFYEQYVRGIKQESTQAMDFGTYIHALVLEPDTLDDHFVIYTGKVRRGKEYEAFCETHKGKIILTESQKLLGEAALNALDESVIIQGPQGAETLTPLSEFLSNGIAEESFFCELDGVKSKARLDYKVVEDGMLIIRDIKTTDYDIDPSDHSKAIKSFSKVCDIFDYDLSAAFYMDVLEKVSGHKVGFFDFVVYSKKNNSWHLFRASEDFLNVGRKKYKEAISRLKRARETGIYYDNKIPEIPALKDPFSSEI